MAPPPYAAPQATTVAAADRSNTQVNGIVHFEPATSHDKTARVLGRGPLGTKVGLKHRTGHSQRRTRDTHIAQRQRTHRGTRRGCLVHLHISKSPSLRASTCHPPSVRGQLPSVTWNRHHPWSTEGHTQGYLQRGIAGLYTSAHKKACAGPCRGAETGPKMDMQIRKRV